MKHIVLLPSFLVLFACAGVRVAPGPVDPDPIDVVPSTVDGYDAVAPIAPWIPPDPIVPSGLEACLAGGGELFEVAAVDNNDHADHGQLLTLGISPTGVLGAAGADGTLKFWTLDAELLASVDGSGLLYGSEEGRVPITDLQFLDDVAIAGDVRGLVAHMAPDGTFYPVGGTVPDVPIRAVAVHAPTQRFAHAQVGDVMPLVVRDMALGGVVEIPTTLETPNDLAFAPGGELFVAGESGGPAIEVRSASDPADVLDTLGFHGSAPITEIAYARESAIGAAISADYIYLLGGLDVSSEVWIPEHQGSSVDVTPRGAFVVSTGADGALLAHDSATRVEVARVAVPDPVTVRVDASGTAVIVGSRDAIIHVFACAP